MDEKANFDTEFTLELSLNSLEGRKFIDVWALSKLQLPNIKRICIDNLIDEDERFHTFLKLWIPENLPLLCLIFGSFFGDDELTKAKSYSQWIANSFLNVKKEIYLRHMELESEDLENIICSSRNSERLMIQYCKIHTPSEINIHTE